MVNITDTFTKLYGRPPTQTELGAMMKLQADTQYVRKLLQSDPEPVQVKKKKPVPRPSRLTCTINKLLFYMLTDEQIVDALGITRKEFDAQVKKYDLPNLKLDGGQPKCK